MTVEVNGIAVIGRISKLDENRRVYIPKDIVSLFGLNSGDSVNVFTRDGEIIIIPVNSKKGN